MIKPAKRLDCVALKNEIQAALLRERQGMTDEEVARQIHRKLATSKTPIGKLWRSLERRRARAPRFAESSLKR